MRSWQDAFSALDAVWQAGRGPLGGCLFNSTKARNLSRIERRGYLRSDGVVPEGFHTTAGHKVQGLVQMVHLGTPLLAEHYLWDHEDNETPAALVVVDVNQILREGDGEADLVGDQNSVDFPMGAVFEAVEERVATFSAEMTDVPAWQAFLAATGAVGVLRTIPPQAMVACRTPDQLFQMLEKNMTLPDQDLPNGRRLREMLARWEPWQHGNAGLPSRDGSPNPLSTAAA